MKQYSKIICKKMTSVNYLGFQSECILQIPEITSNRNLTWTITEIIMILKENNSAAGSLIWNGTFGCFLEQHSYLSWFNSYNNVISTYGRLGWAIMLFDGKITQTVLLITCFSSSFSSLVVFFSLKKKQNISVIPAGKRSIRFFVTIIL